MADIVTNTLQIGNNNLILRDADAQEKIGGLKEELNADVDQLKNALTAVEIVDSASGTIASFADGSDGVPVKGLKVQLEPIQAGSGDPSPTNIRPISGWTGANVTRTGFNVWDEEWELGMISQDTGQNVWGNNIIRTRNYISVIPNGSYYFKTPIALSLRYYDINKNYLGYTDKNGSRDVVNGIRVMPDNTYYLRFQVYATYGTTYNHDISINYPSTGTEYHAYSGTTYPISWQSEAGTVYGGTLDVTTGLLTVTMAEVDLGTLTWTKSDNHFYTPDLQAVISSPVSYTAPTTAKCSKYKSAAFGGVYDETSDYSLGVQTTPVQSKGVVTIYDSSYASSDASTFKNAMSGVQLVYELATPITVQLTAQQVTTILGQNNVWSDADSVSVDYVADTKLYIEQLTEPDADMVADMNITSGKYFMVGNTLYLATANIANGAAITVGVNCTRTSLAEALNAINA